MSAPGKLPAQFGRYRILGQLGAGGMGAVYLAEDTQLGRRVALKVPHLRAEYEPQVLQRFLREARIAASIRHEHICLVYDVGQIDGLHYLTMEYVEGTPLTRRIDRDQPWEPRPAVELLCKLGLAVQVLHMHGVIHRDLKPGNILLRPNGEPVLLDFGLARPCAPQGLELTASGVPVGTPAYMSPEHVRGDKEIGPATDVYSLGVILYELLTGERPFPGPSFAELAGQILFGKLEPPSRLRPGLDTALDALCMKAVAQQAAARFATAEKLAAALAAYLQKRSTHSPPASGTVPGKVTMVCPACGATLKAPATAVGQRRKCPRCKAQIAVTLPVTPPVGAPDGPTQREATKHRTSDPGSLDSQKRGPAHRMLLLGGAGAGVLFLLLLGWLMWGDRISREPGRKGPEQASHQNKEPLVEPRKDDKTVEKPPKKLEEKPKEEKPAEKPKLPPKVSPLPKPKPANDIVTLDLGEGVTMTFVRIPAAGRKFWMGSPASEKDRKPDEDQVEVEFTRDFWMAIHELTQAQYTAITGKANPSYFTKDKAKDMLRFPVENVSWEDSDACVKDLNRRFAATVAKKLGAREVLFDLPTEAQWEYACRASEETSLPFALSSNQANFHGNYPYGGAPIGPYLKRTTTVGSYEPNRFGLYDMHGNVWEWCADYYGPLLGGRDPERTAKHNNEALRVVRGGSWGNDGGRCRAAYRDWNSPGIRLNVIGFRVVFRLDL